MKHENIKLSTSNKNKIEEFKSYGLPFEVVQGKDLKEILSDSVSVAIYKAIDSGDKILVEDTVLLVNGIEVVDIKWKIKDIVKLRNPTIEWRTSLAILDNGFVYVYTGMIECALVQDADKIKAPEDAFGFDPFLTPSPNGFATALTFYELKKEGKKDLFSPRAYATQSLLDGYYTHIVDVKDIKPWTGEYQ